MLGEPVQISLLALFLGGAGILWISTFGYLLALLYTAKRSPRSIAPVESLPEVGVIIPVRNEEEMIGAKLMDLRRSDYPYARMEVLVVDGESADRTAALVRKEAEFDSRIRFVTLNGARGQSEQVTKALALLSHDIAVVTDADTVLDSSCIKELVHAILSDSRTAVVGAMVEPVTPLLEERIHWWFINLLWWLEGEALSAASMSGVCYACRRSLVLPLSQDAEAQDIHVALASGARGFCVRICRSAHSKELRVPRTLGELFQYRRRRGAGYLFELTRAEKSTRTPPGWRLARWMRIWQFLAVPRLALAVVLTGSIMLFTHYRAIPFLALAAFALPLLVAPLFSPILRGEKDRWWRLPWASCRWVIVTLASMLVMRHHPLPGRPAGDRP